MHIVYMWCKGRVAYSKPTIDFRFVGYLFIDYVLDYKIYIENTLDAVYNTTENSRACKMHAFT